MTETRSEKIFQTLEQLDMLYSRQIESMDTDVFAADLEHQSSQRKQQFGLLMQNEDELSGNIYLDDIAGLLEKNRILRKKAALKREQLAAQLKKMAQGKKALSGYSRNNQGSRSPKVLSLKK